MIEQKSIETVAKWLMVIDWLISYDESVSNIQDFIAYLADDRWEELKEDAAKGHWGDCVNMKNVCSKCILEDYYDSARKELGIEVSKSYPRYDSHWYAEIFHVKD